MAAWSWPWPGRPMGCSSSSSRGERFTRLEWFWVDRQRWDFDGFPCPCPCVDWNILGFHASPLFDRTPQHEARRHVAGFWTNYLVSGLVDTAVSFVWANHALVVWWSLLFGGTVEGLCDLRVALAPDDFAGFFGVPRLGSQGAKEDEGKRMVFAFIFLCVFGVWSLISEQSMNSLL